MRLVLCPQSVFRPLAVLALTLTIPSARGDTPDPVYALDVFEVGVPWGSSPDRVQGRTAASRYPAQDDPSALALRAEVAAQDAMVRFGFDDDAGLATIAVDVPQRGLLRRRKAKESCRSLRDYATASLGTATTEGTCSCGSEVATAWQGAELVAELQVNCGTITTATLVLRAP